MLFHRALLSGLLLVPAVLAGSGSSSHFPIYRHRHHGHHHGHHKYHSPLDGNGTIAPDGIVDTLNWAGAVWAQNNGTFNSITGTFTVPKPSGPNNSSAAIWVGIDGATCETAILQCGITLSLDVNGVLQYSAWYEWLPGQMIDISNIAITAGDVIQLNVTTTSSTSGFATVDNLTTGQSNTTFVNSTTPLCGQNAEWIVEDYVLNNSGLVPFANFGTVNFVNASATGPNGTYYPYNATFWDIIQNNQTLTNVSTSATDLSAVTIAHV